MSADSSCVEDKNLLIQKQQKKGGCALYLITLPNNKTP